MLVKEKEDLKNILEKEKENLKLQLEKEIDNLKAELANKESQKVDDIKNNDTPKEENHPNTDINIEQITKEKEDMKIEYEKNIESLKSQLAEKDKAINELKATMISLSEKKEEIKQIEEE